MSQAAYRLPFTQIRPGDAGPTTKTMLFLRRADALAWAKKYNLEHALPGPGLQPEWASPSQLSLTEVSQATYLFLTTTPGQQTMVMD